MIKANTPTEKEEWIGLLGGVVSSILVCDRRAHVFEIRCNDVNLVFSSCNHILKPDVTTQIPFHMASILVSLDSGASRNAGSEK